MRGFQGATLAVLVIAGAMATSAQASLTYPPAQDLGTAAHVYDSPHPPPGPPGLAVDPTGRTSVIWGSYDSSGPYCCPEVQFRRLSADGIAGPQDPLSGEGNPVGSEQVVVDSKGVATVAWVLFSGPDTEIQWRRISVDGTPGPIQAVPAQADTVIDLELAVDRDDRVTVVWSRYDYPEFSNYAIHSLRLAGDGSPGSVRLLSDDGHASEIATAVDSSGRVRVVWALNDYVDEDCCRRIETVLLGADGAPGTVQVLSKRRGYADSPQMELTAGGRATLVWERVEGSYSTVYGRRLGPRGRAGPVWRLSERVIPYEAAPQLAIGPSGSVVVVWGGGRVKLRRIGVKGRLGHTRTITNGAGAPQVEIDSSGRTIVAWCLGYDPGYPPSGSGQDSRWWILAREISPAGKLGVNQVLSTEAVGYTMSRPQLVLDRFNRPTVAWEQGSRIRLTRGILSG